jgi:hypothetical protein
VLPQVFDEANIFSFNYWFNGGIHRGMHHQGDLFCCLGSFAIEHRSQVYLLGYKFSKRGVPIILTCLPATCSLWGSLRSPIVKQILTEAIVLDLPNPTSPTLNVATNSE